MLISGKRVYKVENQVLKCNEFGLFKRDQGDYPKDSEPNIDYW